MEAEKKFFVLGNWKMNVTQKETIDKIAKTLKQSRTPADTDVVIAPPAPYLTYCKERLPEAVTVAGQNCYKVPKGAFTGEMSPAILKDIGIHWVIVGHLERRYIFNESNELIGEKTAHALSEGMNIIAILGETPEDHDADMTQEVVFKQMKHFADNIGDKWDRVVLAYDAIWTSSAGKPASFEQINDIVSSIRSWLTNNVSDAVAKSVRIIYGGMVNGNNCRELAEKTDLDGFLVGSAAFKPEFTEIINARAQTVMSLVKAYNEISIV